ncbi:potassium-transporting ATPase subunit KdpA [Asticcacaulis excentricus]|uniref:Potassium-transporting ATPase potassium-binding subunit n=1 Tax=Asticcacaulis excentricus (strain ATCC 15261 / DSM 4724 / KCTC 12464 / NCIMB 9791 / VKM B-1370 / CB 48) TaxID=573065 RepID=E8RRM4_ASTEC|nr:potassium-transporting ATPase subunit KdpA [Asticcacaulis excentricus]ADU12345.1 potassium-transporting ATPase, A subunit [Asticcacaulis excentricus CB 48]
MFLGIPSAGWLQLVLFMAALTALAVPLGDYVARVLSGQRTWLSPVFTPVEGLIYSMGDVRPDQDMRWTDYATAVILFSFGGFALLFGLLLTQGVLPFNPQHLPNLTPDLAFNTAVSFVTNTNWQSYAGETTLSYFSQMVGLTVQNFVSAAVGIAVLAAVIRGLTGQTTDKLGNFWVDLVRIQLYILLPLALIVAIALSSQGVIQTFASYVTAHTLEGASQTIAMGPVASQEAIKMLGTNGGGFFNTNSAHPFENPTPLSNLIEMLSILLIPAALCFTFGKMIGDRRQGIAIFVAMTLIFVPLTATCIGLEQAGNPHLVAAGAQAGGNMEGKDTRFGIANSAIWATATTAASNGSVNAMHDSFTPLGGLIPMILMQFGEVIYGGAGSGLYGMLVFVILTVFIAGLMVGRTPEYLGKKIGAFEIKMASIAVLLPCALVLICTAVAVLTPWGQAGIYNPGAQGFSEVLYAFTSAANNNGSAFAGLSANSPFYNSLLGLCMLFGRFFVLLPVLAIAGSLAAKRTVPTSAGTLATHTPLFVVFLMGVIIIVGVLTYAPALALGPVIEHLNLIKG